MRSYDSAIALHLADRKPLMVRALVWFVARNRVSGLDEELGLWTGDYDATFTVDGGSRDYFGAGAIMDLPPMIYGDGSEVRTYQMRLSAIAGEAQQLLRGYDPRLARVEIHRAFFNPEAPTTLIAAPVRVFVGFVDEVIFNEEVAGDFTVDINMASTARTLTIPQPIYRSDAGYKQRGGDRIGRYCDVSGVVQVAWGEASANAPPARPVPRPDILDPRPSDR